ncbi:MAG: DUF3025 domain-containing protein [Pseudomonadota bacterium]
MSHAWSPHWRAGSPLFAPLLPLPASLCSTADWPDCAELNRHAAARGLVNTLGLPICFIPDGTASPELSYEARIYHTGQVATRTHNWHDYFNALAWLSWPLSKAALNALHLRAGLSAQRNRARDALTMLDESGVVVACADPALGQHLIQAEWTTLFVTRRRAVQAGMGFYLIGHSLYEKALSAYPAMTGKCTLLRVSADFFALDMAAQLTQLDAALALRLLNQPPRSPVEYAPLPLFGIPGISADSEQPAFYADAQIFRNRRITAVEI